MGDMGPFLAPPVVMETSRRRGVWVLLGVVLVLAVGVLVALFVPDRKAKEPTDTFSIPGEAMAPTYESGDIVQARGIEGDEVSRGDVVVFSSPAGTDEDLPMVMKRVVAVAGDEVAAPDGQLLVNGRPVDEPYLAEGTVTEMLDEAVVVPPDHLYVLGDNRSNSQDSRWFGPIPTSDITALVTGKAPAALQP